MKYCLVAVNTPFNNSLLSYQQSFDVKRGDLVEVPLGTRFVPGCVLEKDLNYSDIKDSLAEDKLKEMRGILSEEICISSDELNLYQWMANYYHYPMGKLIFDSLPKLLKRPKPLIPLKGDGESVLPQMTQEQESVYQAINKKLKEGYSKSLIHGVTGSGKTIVYLNLIKKMLLNNQSVLFLLPEINLTPQFIQTFKDYLKTDIFTYHSAISNSQKYELWKTLKNNSPCVVIGVRSSIFLPISNLGIIIVDEEHDSSFKQEDRCTYNARDIAIKKASLEKIPVVLGSATPSVETYYQFKHHSKDCYFELRRRVNESRLPEIILVDQREKEEKANKDLWPFRESSLSKIKQALEKREQVLVFVNRLGFANYMQCSACGHQFHCPNCAINLKYFHNKKEVHCQYCDYKDHRPDICPECSNLNIMQMGFGTERLQAVLKSVFPQKIIERFDRDDITTFKQLDERLKSFHRGDIDILVGTQMLSKGHNFKKVNLVLIFGVDSQLNFPDFRSNERVYQQLTQISGRSGRFGKESEVLIHTLGPNNKVYEYVKGHDFSTFYNDEIKIRKLSESPPYSKIMSIYLTASKQNEVMNSSYKVAEYLKKLSDEYFEGVDVLGPRPALIEKKVNKYTWVIMLKGSNINNLHNLLNTYQKKYPHNSRINLKIDVDPLKIQ